MAMSNVFKKLEGEDLLTDWVRGIKLFSFIEGVWERF